MDCSPPGSSVHGILQARVLEQLAVLFSRGSSRSWDWTWVFHIAGGFFTIWSTRETHANTASKQILTLPSNHIASSSPSYKSSLTYSCPISITHIWANLMWDLSPNDELSLCSYWGSFVQDKLSFYYLGISEKANVDSFVSVLSGCTWSALTHTWRGHQHGPQISQVQISWVAKEAQRTLTL